MINLLHFASDAPATDASAYQGHWHAIEFQPDLSVPQHFVIGVALTTRGKLSHYRIASEAPRLKCFYEQRYDHNVWKWLTAELINELERAKKLPAKQFTSASPQVRLGAAHYVAASDPDSALNRTFDRVVTVIQKSRPPRNQGITQAQLRETVANRLKLTWKNRYESIAQSEAGLLIRHEDQVHLFDVSFDDAVTASSVVSGCNAGLHTSQLNVYKAWTDLEALARIRNRDQIGLAVLTPTEEMVGGQAVLAWQAFWNDFSYKLRESSKVLLAEDPTPEGLALQISHWYPESS